MSSLHSECRIDERRHPDANFHRYSILDIWRIEGVPQSHLNNQTFHEQLMEGLISADDVAPRYDVVPGAIYDWARKGIIPCVRLGGSVRFHSYIVPGVSRSE